MKRRFLFFFSLSFFSINTNSQVVDYLIPAADLINMVPQSGDMCWDPAEYKQAAVGNTWGFQWTSTNAAMPTSINVDWINVSDEGVAVTTTLNAVANNPFNSTANATCSFTGELISLDPSNYNPLGLNTVLFDFSNATTITTQLYPVAGSYVHVEVTYGAACTDPDVPTLTASSPICPGASSIINIGGNLNDATGWVIYTGSCGGTVDGGTVTSTYTVSPASTTTYYIRGEGGCVTPGSCSSITITVDDSQAPVPDVGTLTDVTAECSVTPPTPTATDDCAGTVPGTPDVSFPITTQGTTVVTWTYDDGNGNMSTQTQNVILNDVTNPVISCPSDITVSNDAGICGATVNYTAPIGTDNCTGPTTSLIAGQLSGSLYPVGTTTNTYEVVDVGGNTAQCSFDVIVNDSENPVISCPSDITVSNDPSVCNAVVNYPTPVGTDNCPGSTTNMIAGLSSGSNFPVGTTVVTYEVIDASANSSQCSFNVIVVDVELPNISCPTNITASNDPGVCSAVINYTAPVTFDNCGIASTNLIAGMTSGSAFPVGTTNVEYETVDFSGNTAQCSFNITVDDAEDPVPDNGSLPDVTNECSANPTPPTATDNCAGTITATPDVSLPITTQGLTTITWTYDDGNGNTTTQTQNVDLNDVTTPVPDNGTLADITAECSASPTAPTATDNCAGTVTATPDVTFPITTQGTTVVTWTYDDGNGNTTTQTQNVILDDVTNPVISQCPGNSTFPADNVGCTAQVMWLDPVATDNCGNVTMTSTHNSGDTFPLGTTTVTYTATDDAGNTATCSFDITVINDLAASAAVTDLLCFGDFSGSIDVTITGGTAPYTFDWNSGTFTTEDITGLWADTYDLTVTDANGCTTSISEVVNEPPVLNITVDAVIDPSGCGNSDGAINVSVSGGTPGYTYSWNSGAFTTEDISGLTAGVYNLTAMDNNGCTAIANAILSDPGAPIITIDTVIDVTCNGFTDGEIQVTISGGSAPYTFDWDNDGTGDNDDMEDLSAVGTGTYNLMVTDAGGCSSSVNATINEPAALDISVTQNGETLTANATGVSYQWIDCSTMNPIAGDTNAVFTATYNGEFAVIIDDGTCQDTSACYLVEGIGFEEMQNVLNVFPNPSEGIFKIELIGISGLVDLEVFDLGGKMIINQSIDVVSDHQNVVIDLTNFEKGTYLLKINTPIGQKTTLLIVQ